MIFLAVVFGLAALTLQLLGRTLPMPVWVVAEVEARLNRSLADGLPGSALSLGGIELTVGEGVVNIEAVVETTGQTGVEMEALTACSVAALTLYDMCKSADKDMVIGEIALWEKSGGRSGDYKKSL